MQRNTSFLSLGFAMRRNTWLHPLDSLHIMTLSHVQPLLLTHGGNDRKRMLSFQQFSNGSSHNNSLVGHVQ